VEARAMATLAQWIHVSAAVIGIGGIGFLLVILMPSLRAIDSEQREALARAVLKRFRWVSWSVIILLLASGLYIVREYYWERPWGRAWFFLTFKIVLAFAVFGISLALTLPLGFFDRVRRRRRLWLAIAFGTGIAVILISAYLRRG
jgi:uncharacterized membrane protein